MKTVVGLAYRQADEGDDYYHIATKLVRYLERKIEQGPRYDVDTDDAEHHDQGRHACEIAKPLDRTFWQSAQRTHGVRLLAVVLCGGDHGVLQRRHRPSAVRTL